MSMDWFGSEDCRQNTSELSADPLAALIPVNEIISSPREYKIITVPVRDSCNQPILISARIYQLGRTEVKFQAASSESKVSGGSDSHLLACHLVWRFH